jgi:RimJ/RimL family protein N-acetyltransferase
MATSPTTIAEDARRPASGLVIELTMDVVVDDLRFSVRPIRPDDAERLVTFHAHLSSRTCYLRYFYLHPMLSATEVERFTHVDYTDRLALVAIRDDRIIGVGRYDRHPGTDEAEVAFVVADECQHHGIGSLLLDLLVVAARTNGIATFAASTLAENRAMRDVFDHAGFAVTQVTEFDTVYLRFPIACTLEYCAALKRRDANRTVLRRGKRVVHPR